MMQSVKRGANRVFSSGIVKSFTAVILGLGLLVPGPGHGQSVSPGVTDPDFIDNQFEFYAVQPCLAGLLALVNAGWTAQEISDYDDEICSVFFPSGTFNNAEGYASSGNIGSIGAISKTSDTVAQQQVKTVQDRLDEIKEEDEREGAWGMMLAVQKGESERAATNSEVGYESDLDGVIGGPDYRFNDNLVAGLVLGSTRDDADYENNAGTLETESRSLMAYTTYLLGDNAYIDGYIGFAQLDFNSERDVSADGDASNIVGFSGQIDSDFEGSQTLIGVSGGYDWYPGNFSYGVFGAIDYNKSEFDDYDEEGDTGLELEYPDQESKSLTLTVGVNGSYTFDAGWGAVTPNISVAVVREEENDSRAFDARLILMPDVDTTALTLETDDPDRNYVLTSLGVVIALNNGAQLFATYEEISSHDFLETSAISVGFLAEF